jgi:hypothetical protein
MSLTDLASLGGFVSGVAVLVSLVFLFFQMRQMTEQLRQSERNQRALMNQGFVNRITEDIRWWADPPFNDLYTRVVSGDTTFTAAEVLHLGWGFRISILNAQDAYLQHKAGLMDTMMFDTAMLNTRARWLTHPVFRALWLNSGPTTHPEFRAVIDNILRETPPAEPGDIVAKFKADLATVMG